MPGGGTLTGAGAIAGATGETTLTEGTGFTVGAAKGAAAVGVAPQYVQNIAWGWISLPHTGQLIIFHFPLHELDNGLLILVTFVFKYNVYVASCVYSFLTSNLILH